MNGKRPKGVTRAGALAHKQAPQLLFRDFARPETPVDLADVVIRSRTVSGTHCHDFYEVFLVKKGVLAYTGSMLRETLSPHTLVFVSPQTIHGFACAQESPMTLISNLAFPAKLFNDCMRFLDNRAVRQQFEQGFTWKEVPALLWERICYSIELLRPDSGLDYAARLGIIKAVILELAAEMLSRVSGEKEKEVPEWLSRACAKMREKENLNWGLARFISLSGKSQEHLTRTLRKVAGVSPTAYINRLRLKNVCELLSTTAQSVTSIAYDSGFNNLAHFNTVFRKEVGMAPREFRRQQGREIVPLREI